MRFYFSMVGLLCGKIRFILMMLPINKLIKILLRLAGAGVIIAGANFAVPANTAMADIVPDQDYDVIHTLTFAAGSGTCNIRLYLGSSTAYTGTVYYRAGTSGAWTELSVSGTETTFPVSSTTMQIGHAHNKSGNNYMTVSFYGQSTNLTGIAISQKAAYSGTMGNYFMYRYGYGCSALTSLVVPDTSGLTSVGTYFMAAYADGCSSLNSLTAPDTSGLKSVGNYFMYNHARGCSSLNSLAAPDISGLTSVGTNFMYLYGYGCTSLTSLSIPDTSSITNAGSSFMASYAQNCSSLLRLELPAVGWFATHDVNWSVPSGRLGYLKGYVSNSTDEAAWKALTASTKTLYLNYIRSSDDVINEEPTAPAFLVAPHENPTSDDTTPTNAGDNVTIKATAMDGNGDQWYLAVCKTDEIATSTDAAPTCPGSEWAISDATDSASEATASYTVTESETSESYAWYAFACDKTASTPQCSAMSNSGTEGNNGSPFAVNHAPNAPSSLGPADYIDGSWQTDTTPILRFTQSDDDESDTVKYLIQIDDSADFGSPVVDYTSALMAQGVVEFTVGQTEGDGSYAAGSQDQTLIDGTSYYWRVMSTDNGDLTSSWTTANSGNIAFKIDASAPSTPAVTDNGTYTTSARQLHASWTSADEHSDIADNQYCISTDTADCATGTITDWTSTAAAQEVTKTGLTLSDGTTYYFHIKTQNHAGSWSSIGHSDGIMVDASAPSNVGIDSIAADSTTQLTITATAATDSGAGLHAVPYWFAETSGNSGGSSSADWQESTIFIDDGLSPNTQYVYKVKARDALENESNYSTEPSAYTLANVPASLAAVADSQTQITLTWEANGNPSGTEYYIENQTDESNSEWITDAEYSFTGLACGTEYVFRAKARNAENTETSWTDDVSAATNACDEEQTQTTPSPSTGISGQYMPGFGYDYQNQTQNQNQEPADSFIPQFKIPEPARNLTADIGQIAQSMWEPVKETVQNIKEILFPEEPPFQDNFAPTTQKQPTPAAFNGQWNLLAAGASKFALAPLPPELMELKNNFSQINNLFDQTGVAKAADLPKLAGVQLSVPGLSEIVGGQTVNIILDDLPQSAKDKIPQAQIFVQSLGDLDLGVKVKLDMQGSLAQTVRTIVRYPVNLTIKVDRPAQRVYGYLIAKGTAAIQSQNILARAGYLLASLVNADSAPKELLLEKFNYADPDSDNIYEAQIYAPAVKGDYRVRTVIEYADEQEEREINMDLVVDPEGYVYTNSVLGEVRIKNAQVSLYQLNSQTGGYQLWSAQDFAQQNPQTTGITGQYAFLSPPGTYYLQVDAPGYRQFRGESFELNQNQAVHENIELIPIKTAWWNFDWKFWVLAGLLALIFIALLILIYNKNRKN